jgi:DNA-binding transcriptional LysR family regulator
MIALRIGEDARLTVVASPDYLRRHGTPKEPGDLSAHNCTRLRFASNAPNRWFFEKRGKSIEVDVTGSLIAGDSGLAVRAALDGVALARVPLHAVEAHLATKTLVAVLEEWRPRSVGFYLYYPSRRQMPAALQALISTLKAEIPARSREETSVPRSLPKQSVKLRASRVPAR